jgi:NADPH:quinone reductase-like Zn-dependent oxidoreductase
MNNRNSVNEAPSLPATMQAVRFHDYSGIGGLRLEEAGLPEVGPGQILVRVFAAGVNPFDIYAVAGYANEFVTFKLPAVLGRDFSGIVVKLGSDTDNFSVGDAVYGQANPEAPGTFAEYTIVETFRAIKKPVHLSHVEAASLPNVILAAWNGLFSETSGMGLKPDQTILIHGAAGGIGSVAVQLANWRGAHVLGTASAHNIAFLNELGVKRAFDYNAADWEAAVGKVDAVLDNSSGAAAEKLCGLIRPGGFYVGLQGPLDAAIAAKQQAAGIRCVTVNGPASLADLPAIAAAVAGKHVKPVVSGIYPLAEFRDALEKIAEGHVRGKLVLRVRDEEV